MDKFIFSDGQQICYYNCGAVKKQPSKFIENYVSSSQEIYKAKKWKQTGDGAQFRGDITYDNNIKFDYSINGIFPSQIEGEVFYSFTVNETSGIYKKDFNSEKNEESHVINSLDINFGDGSFNVDINKLAITLKRNDFNSDVALFDIKTGDYYTFTDGDTLDEDPFINPTKPNEIYFSSRGVGRTANGDFSEFAPAAICKLDIDALTVDYVLSDAKYSYLKPKIYNGKLYAIRTPSKVKSENPLLEIILIPVRFVQAIANLLNIFIHAFTGKSITSGGANPAKGRKYNSKKTYVAGNLINVDKELKKNASKKDSDYGFIPLSWQLIEVDSGTVIKSGVCDYDVADDGSVLVTNGKRIIEIKDGKSKKLFNCDYCLKVAYVKKPQENKSIFDLDKA